MANLDDYEWLVSAEGQAALEATDGGEPVHRQLTRLRKSLSADRASLIVQQLELRLRAIEKFGELASRMFFTDVGLQQSTDLRIARYKASRFPQDADIVDYCTGVGGDLLALAERGTVSGWDSSAEVATLANANLIAANSDTLSKVHVGSAEAHLPDAQQFWHLDPDRRVDGRRSTQLKWHSPGPEVVDSWVASSSSGALKVAPASETPEDWEQQSEREWISRDRECRQQVIWFGELAESPGMRRATRIASESPTEQRATFVGESDESASKTDSVSQFIYDTDPAIRAAGLTGAIANAEGLMALGEGGSYLTGATTAEHPLLTRFEVREVLPLRADKIGQHLRSLNIGRVEIKKRGVDIEPERLRQQLKLSGDQAATLLLTRVGAREIAVLAQRDKG